MVGFCGSDLNSFRGLNPLVSFPRILGHEVSASVVLGDGCDSELTPGMDVALCPYTSCGKCASCRRGRSNACQFNQTLGVQRDGALREFIVMPRDKLYPARLTPKELCLVEPLTVLCMSSRRRSPRWNGAQKCISARSARSLKRWAASCKSLPRCRME